VSDLTTDKLTELLHKKADAELESRLEWLIKEARREGNRLRTTTDIKDNGGYFLIPKDTWIPGVLLAVEKMLVEAHRDTNRANYVAQWLHKVNETLDAVNDLQGGAQ
jgi:hypothetical protein